MGGIVNACTSGCSTEEGRVRSLAFNAVNMLATRNADAFFQLCDRQKVVVVLEANRVVGFRFLDPWGSGDTLFMLDHDANRYSLVIPDRIVLNRIERPDGVYLTTATENTGNRPSLVLVFRETREGVRIVGLQETDGTSPSVIAQ
ncbi:MAG: hypothetical protein C0404_05285 [Verrucomicrobia bacterium]|nr:hypothetical protein [Verrucomicrobiota bacterium]